MRIYQLLTNDCLQHPRVGDARFLLAASCEIQLLGETVRHERTQHAPCRISYVSTADCAKVANLRQNFISSFPLVFAKNV